MLTLTADRARRFLVRRHFLAPPRSLPATANGVMSVVERLGSLQFDPLEVPGARNHDLVLHARLRHHRRGLCEPLLYSADRKLFEAYNKSLNLLPVAELPWHRFAWRRASAGRVGLLLRKHEDLANRILLRLAREGPLGPSAFETTTKIRGYWGQPTSLTRHVLDALFMTGRVGIARRDGNKRTYDRIERLFDPALLAKEVSDDEAKKHRLLSRHRAVGLMGAQGATELISGIAPAAERRRHLAALVDSGVLLEANVEGVPGVRHIVKTERDLLLGAEPSAASKGVAFLAPLDPLLWDRKLLRTLFGYDYTWEVYTPVAKRKHGYYVLPILFGDRLVGRIEPRFERATQELRIAGAWLEAGFDPDEPGFLAAAGEALREYAAFVGAPRTTFGRSRVCRLLAMTKP